MKKIYRTRKGIRVDEVPSPTPGDRQVLVQVLWSVISTGTETASIRKSLEASRRELTHPISLGKKAINVVKHPNKFQKGMLKRITRRRIGWWKYYNPMGKDYVGAVEKKEAIAGVNLWLFHEELLMANISPSLDEYDLSDDIKTIRTLRLGRGNSNHS